MLKVKIKLRPGKVDIISSYLGENDLDYEIGVRSTSAAGMTIYKRFVNFYTPEEIQKVVDYFKIHPPPEKVMKELNLQLSGGDR